MGFTNSIYSGHGDKGYIRWDSDMLTVFDITTKEEKARAGAVNVLVHVLNDLNYALQDAIKNNQELNSCVIEIARKDVEQAMFNDPLKGKPKHARNKKQKELDVREAHKLIHLMQDIAKVYVQVDNNLTFINCYESIQVPLDDENALVEISITQKFIQYYKAVLFRDGEEQKYGKLYLDIMLSLSTFYQKLVYAYLAAELEKNYCTNWINIGGESDKLTRFLNVRQDDLPRTIEGAVNAINKVIDYKREKYNMAIPKYQVEWKKIDYRASKGKNSKIHQFKFSKDMEELKEAQAKYAKKKSYEEIICKFTEDEAVRYVLREFIQDSIEAENYISVQSFETQLNKLKGLEDHEIIYRLSEAIINGSHRKIGY